MQVEGDDFMIISIVGKSSSGKSYISKLLNHYSNKIVNLNIDKVGHYVLTLDEVKMQLIKLFGPSVIKDNMVDRKTLGEIVFNNQKNMDKLTEITWNSMQQIIDKFIDDNKNKIIILDWLLLPKSKYFNISDIKILVDAPYDIRLKRAIKRDNITEDQFKTREKASLNFNISDFDYVINNIEKEKTKRKVRDIYDKSIISR